ncbi:MAG: ATP-binding protein [Verrucomicrobiales bacterium]
MGHSKAGKTWLMFELQRRWHEHGAKVCATSGTEFAYVCGDPDQAARRDLIERMIKADLLFIDDLGKEKMTDRVEADLFHVIEQRRRFQKPVFVTVNSDGTALASRMSDDGGAPIINRLREDVCEFIRVAKANP